MRIKKTYLFLFFLVLVACGDNESSKNNPIEAVEISSSLEEENFSSSAVSSSSSSSLEEKILSTPNDSSSSSVKVEESSNSKKNEVPFSSSKVQDSSSSAKVAASSSSTRIEASSSSKKVEDLSSSSKVQDSSSSTKVAASSSSTKTEPSSSSEKPAESSSSEKVAESSSSEKSSSSVGIPSKLYDCETYKCVTTKRLNPNIDYGEYLDERDSLVYRTVNIGTQVWMAQNLNYSTQNSFCLADKEGNCSLYGRLYDWKTAQNICPEGWHLPDTLDFQELKDYASKNNGGIGVGTSLKSGKNDIFGFSSLAHGGYKAESDGLCYESNKDFYWTTTEDTNDQNYAKSRGFRQDESYMTYNTFKKAWLLSVRCIKD